MPQCTAASILPRSRPSLWLTLFLLLCALYAFSMRPVPLLPQVDQRPLFGKCIRDTLNYVQVCSGLCRDVESHCHGLAIPFSRCSQYMPSPAHTTCSTT